ncbi:MAG TPA: hypothetical protein VE869_08620 [Gemmatimonas sp.]|nr:hypothetical protein [Gemmatimonas sp.]
MRGARVATLPFELTSNHQVIGAGTFTRTEERRHGVLRLERDTLVVQWRVEREVRQYGPETRTDVERDGLRDVAVPVRMLGDVRVSTRGRLWWRRWELVVTARDLVAFDGLVGADGFVFDHPATLVLPVQTSNIELAQEFASEVALAVAELAMADAVAASALPVPASVAALPLSLHSEHPQAG